MKFNLKFFSMLNLILLTNIIQARSYKDLKDNSKFPLTDVDHNQTENDTNASCDERKPKKDCTAQRLCSIIGKVNSLKSQVTTVDSNINVGFLNVEGDLDEIKELQEEQSSKLDDCCANLTSKYNKLSKGLSSGFRNVEDDLDEVLEVTEVQSSKLDDCCLTLNSKLDNIDFGVNSRIEQCCIFLGEEISNANTCCFTVNSKLDFILSRTSSGGSSCMCTCNCSGTNTCASKPILSPTTITSSGTYCLIQNINSANTETILINASNVILDLNSFNVDNVSTLTNQAAIRTASFINNIVIKNGSVTHNGNSNGLGVGIEMNSQIVTIDDISVGGAPGGNTGFSIGLLNNGSRTRIIETDFIFNTTGLMTFSSSDLRLESCLFQGATSDGAVLNGVDLYMKDCVFSTTSNNGLNLNNVFGAVIYNSNFLNNINGVIVQNSGDIAFYNCVAERNQRVASNGFLIMNSSSILFNNCYAADNSSFLGLGVGFNIIGTFRFNAVNCIAKHNFIGFSIDANTTGVVRGCTSDGNVAIGFQNSSSNVAFFSNVACNNPTGFSGVTNAAVTSSANATAFQNVDCSITTVNQIESKLDLLLTRTCCNIC